MLSKAEIDQNLGFASDAAFRLYVGCFIVMLMGFISIFFLGIAIVMLVLSIGHISKGLKSAYIENGIPEKQSDSDRFNVSKNLELSFYDKDFESSEQPRKAGFDSTSLSNSFGCAGDRIYSAYYARSNR